MMPKRGQSNRRTENSASTVREEKSRGLSSTLRLRPEGKPAAPWRPAGFTLIEMLVAVGLLLVMMGLAGQVFKIALDGTGRLTQLSEIDRSIRDIQDTLTRELATVDPTRSILAIQGNPSPAYWTEEQQQRDDDGNVLNGIGNQQYIIDPLRENPTLGYDVLDTKSTTGNPSPDGSYDWTTNDDFYPLLPRADILMYIANLPDESSKIRLDDDSEQDDPIHSDGPVMIVWNHAELGTLAIDERRVRVSITCPPGRDDALCGDNDSTDDWGDPPTLEPIPSLQPDRGMDPRPNVQLVARDWHLARRAILLKDTFDSKENPPAPATGAGFDRYAHVLSPTNPAGNAFVGFIQGSPLPTGINGQYEQHYLNWILGGEMDVVSPAGGPVSVAFLNAAGGTLQDFVYEYEVPNRYFGGANTLDSLVEDFNQDGTVDAGIAIGSVSTRRQDGNVGFFRGAVPAWWLGRSQLDVAPPGDVGYRYAHMNTANCASFKVEWTPNDIRLEQAGLPEVVWIDPFKEPGANNRLLAPLPGTHPDNPITLASVTKPMHLDEFEIIAQKMASAANIDLINNAVLGDGSAFGFNGNLLLQVHRQLKPRFALSLDPNAGNVDYAGVQPAQANVFDGDPTTASPGVQPSYNTHSWYAKNLEFIPIGGPPKTSTSPDPLWPKALRITIDLFDDAGKLDRPVRHTFIVPIGSKGDRKSS